MKREHNSANNMLSCFLKFRAYPKNADTIFKQTLHFCQYFIHGVMIQNMYQGSLPRLISGRTLLKKSLSLNCSMLFVFFGLQLLVSHTKSSDRRGLHVCKNKTNHSQVVY